MERVERTNAVILCPQQREGVAQKNLYAIEIDRERNCYTCGRFRYMARHCRNKGGESELEMAEDWNIVIKREYGQTLARVRVSWTKIVSIIISLQ